MTKTFDISEFEQKKMELKKLRQPSFYMMFQTLLFVEAHFQSENQYLSTT